MNEPAGARRSDTWMQTFTGRHFSPLHPAPEHVDIEDIAHALSRICRFGGHSKDHYCVAQHSVEVSYLCWPEHALLGLLHDSPETYLGDVVGPLKVGLPNYAALETEWAKAIGSHFGVALSPLPTDVKDADRMMLAIEAREIMPFPSEEWLRVFGPNAAENIAHHLAISKARALAGKPEEPAPFLSPWDAATAKQRFLRRFRELR